jgi:hypothetical protein
VPDLSRHHAGAGRLEEAGHGFTSLSCAQEGDVVVDRMQKFVSGYSEQRAKCDNVLAFEPWVTGRGLPVGQGEGGRRKLGSGDRCFAIGYPIR